MAEECQSKEVLVKKHQSKSDAAEIQKVKENGKIGPGPGNLCKFGGIQQNNPGWNDQQQHDNVIAGKLKIVFV